MGAELKKKRGHQLECKSWYNGSK